MAYYPDYVKIFSIIAHNRKLFFVCDIDNELAIHTVETYAKRFTTSRPSYKVTATW